MKSLAFASIGLLGACLVNAQEVQRFTFNAGGGFTMPAGNTARFLDTGWNAGVGAGVNWNNYFATLIQFQYNDMNINGSNLAAIGVPGGDVAFWSVTLDPKIHLAPKSHVDVYLVGGGGLYSRRQEFTAPTTAIVPGFDPFFGFGEFAVPATEVLSSDTIYKPGFNVGAGVAFGTKWHAKFFAEARWHHMFLSDAVTHNDYIPVTFGVTF